ncbi:glucose-6-phosphate dehydrogenase [Rhodoplanes sp. Z2-YC6860]|uniref:glucose-6-phosphate dehydrogenase n=1 Tax=Rhodoplanes sp. Z2-YC6860 TaxID=674703 RepID=UPI0008376948|nr:glucose-6-phosphate dehydrogenase [Rhodoplanes sp. Z2-YC6860]
MADRVQPAPPCVLVIFGAAGDLTKRLLVPALYNLRRSKLLPEEFSIVGVARAEKDDEAFRRDFDESMRKFSSASENEADWKWLRERMSYLKGDLEDAETYQALGKRLVQSGGRAGPSGNVLFYLATPPAVFAPVIGQLGRAELLREQDGNWRRVIIEKPFGTDLRSAQELNRQILSVMSENQIYRIDHYLGKETVQNIMVFRFGNGIFEPLWNRNHIDHVQITVAETVGVETRGKFYDATGALRDMVPNHLFQLLELVAMEPPTCFAADAVRTEKGKVLEAVHPFGKADALRNVVRGQYGSGAVNGKAVKAYRESPEVAPDSAMETYVALKVMIDNWRWAGVPFYLRTGKALVTRRSEIVIRFKQAPFALFRDTPVERLTPNDLVLHIQPEEGVTLSFGAKKPGPKVTMGGVQMRFDYKDYFEAAPSTGYETLVYDCMTGDTTLFKRAEEIEAGWRIVQPLLDAWSKDRNEPAAYPAGSEGPAEANELMARDGRQWRPLDQNGKKS